MEFTVGGSVQNGVRPSPTVTSAETYAAAAVAGLGLIQAPRFYLEPYLRAGELVEVLQDYAPSPASLLYPRSKKLSPRLRSFINWVVTLF